MNRRSFLSHSLLSAASFGVGSALPFGRRGRFGIRSAEAAGQPTPYPVYLIHINGGWDPAMHLVAMPNGSYGEVTFFNRLPGSSSFRTNTKSNITYAPSVVAPTGKTDFEPHLDDVALLRTMVTDTDHYFVSSSWFGLPTGSGLARFGRLPWASVLAAQFRKRGFFVPKPVSAAYRQSGIQNEPWRNLVTYGTESPDPATRTDRILSIPGFFDAISNAGVPIPALQTPAYDLIDALDQAGPTATQPDYAARFASANLGTSEVLKRTASGSAWPPAADVITKLGLTSTSVNQPLDLLGDAAPYEHMFALAFQALSKDLAHVICHRDKYLWDSHTSNLISQTTRGNALWPALGKFITLLKNTPSIIDSTKSMFDTTNIWIQSEMGRSPGYETLDQFGTEGKTGTKHWEDTFAVFLGGRFKRGIAIGKYDSKWKTTPLNLATGQESDSGTKPNIANVIATVMKAAGGNPSEFTNAQPIDALLDMSRF